MESFGRYQLLKTLARGGMGEVHLARQAGVEGFEKLVVIKRVLPHLAEDKEFIDMFLDEGRIAARLNHPNVVQIFDLGKEGEYFYMAMEYIHGEDIRRVIRAGAELGRKLPTGLSCRIISEAAAGLDYAHKKADDKGVALGIVHRDISPQNILVTFDGGVKVIDFGIARARNRATQTETGAIKGRFEYMSPEHASGKPVDARSDIFALGVVLWEMLTGERLFKRDHEMSTLLAVSECKVPPPSSRSSEIPPELDPIVLKALAREKEDRYPDAQAFRLALEDYIVQTRQGASSAHLAAFMGDIYKDRLSVESTLGHPTFDEPTPSSPSMPGVVPPPLDGGAPTVSRKPQIVPTGQTNPNGAPVASPNVVVAPAPEPRNEPAPKESPAKKFVVPALVVLALGLVGVVAFRKPAPVDPTPAPTPAPAPVPTPAPTPAPPSEVRLKVSSSPIGAEVYVGPDLLGHTPLDTVLPRSNRAVLLELKLAGHLPATQEIIPLESMNVSVALQAEAVKPVVAPKPTPKPGDVTPPIEPVKPTPPPLDLKLDR